MEHLPMIDLTISDAESRDLGTYRVRVDSGFDHLRAVLFDSKLYQEQFGHLSEETSNFSGYLVSFCEEKFSVHWVTHQEQIATDILIGFVENFGNSVASWALCLELSSVSLPEETYYLQRKKKYIEYLEQELGNKEDQLIKKDEEILKKNEDLVRKQEEFVRQQKELKTRLEASEKHHRENTALLEYQLNMFREKEKRKRSQ